MNTTTYRTTANYLFSSRTFKIGVPAGETVYTVRPDASPYVRCYVAVQVGGYTVEAYADVDQTHLVEM